MLRILLIEDEAWVREAVASVLAGFPGFAIVAACRSVSETLLTLSSPVAFDVALVDLGLPDGSGLSLLPRLRATCPAAGLIAFTVFDEPATVFAAMRAGARGYLLKSTPLDLLPSKLVEIAEGGAPMSPAIARMVLDTLAPPEPAPRPLTPRERDILGLLAKGHTYADVGRALGIGLGTVQTHVKALYDKLHVASKAEAAVEATKLGLI